MLSTGGMCESASWGKMPRLRVLTGRDVDSPDDVIGKHLAAASLDDALGIKEPVRTR